MTKQQHQQIVDAIDAVRTDIVDVAVAVKARFDKVDERFGGVETRLEGVETRLEGMETRLGGVEKRLGNLEKQIDRRSREILVHVDRVYQEVAGRITDLESAKAKGNTGFQR